MTQIELTTADQATLNAIAKTLSPPLSTEQYVDDKASLSVNEHKTAGIGDHDDVDLDGIQVGDVLQAVDDDGLKLKRQQFPSITRQMLSDDEWNDISINDLGLFTTTSGSGSYSPESFRRGVLRIGGDGGVTIGGSSFDGFSVGNLGAASYRRIDWTKTVLIKATMTVSTSINGVRRFALGHHQDDHIQDLDDRGIGFKIIDNAVHGMVYKDSLSLIDLNTSIVLDRTYQYMCISDGQGGAQWFIDGILVGNSNQAPDSIGPINQVALKIMHNGSVDSRLNLHNVKTYSQQ